MSVCELQTDLQCTMIQPRRVTQGLHLAEYLSSHENIGSAHAPPMHSPDLKGRREQFYPAPQRQRMLATRRLAGAERVLARGLPGKARLLSGAATHPAFPAGPTWSVAELRERNPSPLDAKTLKQVAGLSRLHVDAESDAGRKLREQLGAILATARKVANAAEVTVAAASSGRACMPASRAGAGAEALAGFEGEHDLPPAESEEARVLGQADVPAGSAGLRPDIAPSAALRREALLAAAPASRPPYFAVPKVLGDVAEEG